MNWIAKCVGFLNCCVIYFWLAIVYQCIKFLIVGVADDLWARALFGVCVFTLIGGFVAICWFIKKRVDLIKNGINPQPTPKPVIIIEIVMMLFLAVVLALPYLNIV